MHFSTPFCLIIGLSLLPSLAVADEPVATATAPTSPSSISAPDVTIQTPSTRPSLAATIQKQPAWANFASGKGALLYGAAGTLLPLTRGGREGRDESLRVADSVITSGIVTEALKAFTHEQRPDGSDYKSFPSEHATAAFAIATMQAHFHPNQSLLWYAGATVIAASRLKLRRHRLRDVLAGAAIGVATSRIEIRQKRGLLLAPFISGSGSNRSSGVSLGGAF